MTDGTDAARYDAVVVVSFGGPEGPDDVMPFLENVTRGRGVPRERLEEVAEQYMLFGGVSPINAQTGALVDALRAELGADGPDLPVYWGNRNWRPYLADTMAEMAHDGVRRALAFVTSAYSSYSACRQYLEDIDAARAAVGPEAPSVDKIRQYWNHPGFVDPFRDGLRAALADLGDRDARRTHLLFTAHSLPLSMAASSDYELQLRDAMELVAGHVAPDAPRELVWQSRSGPPQVPWLEPDVNDRLRTLSTTGVDQVVIVPVGFTSDHQEVVFDLDTQAAATAREVGIEVRRVPTPGVDPRFVRMVRDLVEERCVGATPVALGPLGPRSAPCAAGCCPAPTRPG
ncbi:ferrochelatase [Actinomarinicola tropica]|uniref:Coproporphyrin III ferrochelatase n=1 Tax=Actinomarinicola tropica TaxID=2789776 RepID=A0A5Q2RMM1_9ACTN|nr:ferrochelatase [Actinomarinicola tropica]QGG96182.1 ferrochelatase [Actinomarinicola tropica]